MQDRRTRICILFLSCIQLYFCVTLLWMVQFLRQKPFWKYCLVPSLPSNRKNSNRKTNEMSFCNDMDVHPLPSELERVCERCLVPSLPSTVISFNKALYLMRNQNLAQSWIRHVCVHVTVSVLIGGWACVFVRLPASKLECMCVHVSARIKSWSCICVHLRVLRAAQCL